MYIPLKLLFPIVVMMFGVIVWTGLLVWGRNPLPLPDNGSLIFAAASAEGKSASVELLAAHGVGKRFQVNTDGVSRSIMWDGTIVNYSSEEVSRKLGSAAASIGLVADDPAANANAAADFLRSRATNVDRKQKREACLGPPIVAVGAGSLKLPRMPKGRKMVNSHRSP